MAAAQLQQHLGDVRRFEKDQIIHYEKPAEVQQHQLRWNAAIEQSARLAQQLGQGPSDAATAAAAA